MVERRFPPLAPHFTQAFTVMMMARFFETYLLDRSDPQRQAAKKGKLKLKAFVAQVKERARWWS
eukprot:5084773-Pleurochrysis_carterae.AAC.1